MQEESFAKNPNELSFEFGEKKHKRIDLQKHKDKINKFLHIGGPKKSDYQKKKEGEIEKSFDMFVDTRVSNALFINEQLKMRANSIHHG